MAVEYVRLSEGLNSYELVPSTDNIFNRIKSFEKDYYVSIFRYNEEQFKYWKENKTVSGIKDVVTNKLFFDFDNEKNPEAARQDAITLVSRLLKTGIPENTIQVAFSGNKGFSVEVATTDVMSQEQFKNTTFALASDLETFDTVVNDPQRIVRVVGTKHNKSKLYKLPMTVSQLSELDIPTIKSMASDFSNVDEDIVNSWKEVELPSSIKELQYTKKEEPVEPSGQTEEVDLRLKPKWMTEAKFALQQGMFNDGERNEACMILASTYKNQGFPKEITYRILKGTLELRANRLGHKDYDKKELWSTVIELVYSPHWKGGMYSYETTPLLQKVTKRLGLKPPKDEEQPLVTLDKVTDLFKRFALDIDKNTIKLGIPMIDNNIKVTTSMLVGVLAAPSAGKTTVSLNILNAASKSGIKSAFYSLDMGAPLVYQRLIQRHTGYQGKHIFDLYKTGSADIKKFEQTLETEYANVKFCFKSGISVEDMREFVIKEQEKSGDKIRLLVVDYLECIQGTFSDATANTAMIAQKLKDLANELELCIILLLQPQKHAGDPSAELLSYRQIKGSSAIEQAASVIFTLWRPGFSAKNPQDDRFITFAVVKNRMGSLASFDFSWDGLTGNIDELGDEEAEELDKLRKRRALEKAQADGGI